jgi:hypothetical protein
MARLAIVDAPLDGSGRGARRAERPAARRVRGDRRRRAFRRADGSYRFENRFRYLIAEA